MVYTSTTDRIAGHSILRHGKIVCVEERFNYCEDAIQFAMESLMEKAEDYDYNAIIGIRHQIREESDGIYVSLMGTLVAVD